MGRCSVLGIVYIGSGAGIATTILMVGLLVMHMYTLLRLYT
jgi:hypothetical protein